MRAAERGGSTALPPGSAPPHPRQGKPRERRGPSPSPQAALKPGPGPPPAAPPLTCRGPRAAPAAPEGDGGRARPAAATGGAVAAATRRDMAAGGREPGLWERVCAGGRGAPGPARPGPRSALRGSVLRLSPAQGLLTAAPLRAGAGGLPPRLGAPVAVPGLWKRQPPAFPAPRAGPWLLLGGFGEHRPSAVRVQALVLVFSKSWS